MIQRIVTYIDAGQTLRFVRIRDAPGFTHRVVINGIAKDWLAEGHKPNGKSARFYFDKHIHGVTT